jgi:hypothetical protein
VAARRSQPVLLHRSNVVGVAVPFASLNDERSGMAKRNVSDVPPPRMSLVS